MPPADSEGKMQEKPEQRASVNESLMKAADQARRFFVKVPPDKPITEPPDPFSEPSVPPMTQAEKNEQDRALYRTVERESVPPQRVEPEKAIGERSANASANECGVRFAYMSPSVFEGRTIDRCRLAPGHIGQHRPYRVHPLEPTAPRVDSVEPPASQPEPDSWEGREHKRWP